MTNSPLTTEDPMVGSYALASGLVGFPSSTLRVRIKRAEGSYVWVRTADLLDAGTALVLDASQVEPERAQEDARHGSGLLAFGVLA